MMTQTCVTNGCLKLAVLLPRSGGVVVHRRVAAPAIIMGRGQQMIVTPCNSDSCAS